MPPPTRSSRAPSTPTRAESPRAACSSPCAASSTDGHRSPPPPPNRAPPCSSSSTRSTCRCRRSSSPDGLDALAALARQVVARVRCARARCRIVGVTGSNGKTTTKNLLRAILQAEGDTVARAGRSTIRSARPISMLRIDRRHRVPRRRDGCERPSARSPAWCRSRTPDVGSRAQGRPRPRRRVRRHRGDVAREGRDGDRARRRTPSRSSTPTTHASRRWPSRPPPASCSSASAPTPTSAPTRPRRARARHGFTSRRPTGQPLACGFGVLGEHHV